MNEFNLSKSVILKEIYIREIPLILYRMRSKQRFKTLEKLHDNLLALRIAAATAGLGASAEMIKDIQNGLEQTILKLDPDALKNTTETELTLTGSEAAEGQKKDPFEQLEQLQGLIAQTRKGKRIK